MTPPLRPPLRWGTRGEAQPGSKVDPFGSLLNELVFLLRPGESNPGIQVGDRSGLSTGGSGHPRVRRTAGLARRRKDQSSWQMPENW